MIAPYYERAGVTLYRGDCRDVLASMDECSIDAIVTDPPYGIGFMGKGWDNAGVAYDVKTWAAALRVLKPGGYLVAFGAPRTHHRLTVAIEDAGFEIRDVLMWLFGSGFPKSLDVSKAIDKAAGAEREIVGSKLGQPGYSVANNAKNERAAYGRFEGDETAITAPATEAAATWAGWGTALKPAYEPIVLARKPLRGTVAANVGAYGTGGLNIDGCRIGDEPITQHGRGDSLNVAMENPNYAEPAGRAWSGRWPANVLLDTEAAQVLDLQSGQLTSGSGEPFNRNADKFRNTYSTFEGRPAEQGFYGDTGGASRFFYTAKTSRSEREFGLDDMEPTRRSDGRKTEHNVPNLRTNERRNDHPTVKPVDLMRWLCRLVTPPNGVVLDPFLGSGSTGMAALDEGFRFIGVDLDAHYLDIAKSRITRRHLIEPMPSPLSGQGALI